MDRGAWPDGVEYWNNQRVVVTGGAGCLGRYVVCVGEAFFDCPRLGTRPAEGTA